MNSSAIGVFDSGLGGLTAVKELLHTLPNENVIYFGDTSRVPYGNRSNKTIRKYALQDARFLLSHNVKAVVAACGTVSSVAGDLSKQLNVPYTGVVKPTSFSAAKKTKNGRIGIIGTCATISSHSYKNELLKINNEFKVFEKSCPLFVPLVENGFIDKSDDIVRLVIERNLSDIKNEGIDTLILGCTHYPIIKDAISYVMGEGVTLIDSGRETALYLKKILNENDIVNTSGEKGNCSFYVSDTPDDFEKTASLFLGNDITHKVTQINIEEY